jgi:flagellar basal body P-ring formation protein FlgA
MRGQITRMAVLSILGLGLGWHQRAAAQADSHRPNTSAGTQLVVSLRASAVVDKPIVTVGAVATFEGGEPALRQMIAGLDVAEVSRVGQSVAVSREQVALRIQLAGVDAQRFRMDGPAQVMVKIHAIELTEQEIVKAAQQAIVQRLKADPKDVDFRLLEEVRVPAVNIAPGDGLHFAVESQAPPGATGKLHVEVGILVNGQRRGVAPVVLDVALYRQVAVATRRLEAGETLQPYHVRPERRVLGAHDQWLAYNDQLLGKRVQHTVPANQVLSGGDLDLPAEEDEVVIHARDNVKLVAVVGNLRVSVGGEAQQEGKVGQTIHVRNTDSGKIVTGRVLDRSTVEVEY